MRNFTITFMLLTLAAHAVTLEWNANPEPDIAGYELEVSGDAVESVLTVGTRASVDLPPGSYRFAVRAVDMQGNESPLSAPLDHTIPAAAWPRVTVSSEAPQFPKENLIDGKDLPIFATFYQPAPDAPQWMELEIEEPRWIGGLRYLPRQDDYTPGHVTGYQVLADGATVADAEFMTQDKGAKVIAFRPVLAKRVRLQSTLTHFTASEISLIEAKPPMVRFSFQYGSDLVGWEDLPPIERPKKERGFVRWKMEVLP